MPIHDIIDNRNEKLVDHINRIVASIITCRNGWNGAVSQTMTVRFRGLFAAKG